MIINNKLYDALRFVAEICLPAIGALLAALGEIWSFRYAEIVATLAAVDTFLGAFVAYSKHKYDKAGGE